MEKREKLGPGHINFGGEIKGHYTQTEAVWLDATPPGSDNDRLTVADALNEFFAQHPNSLLVEFLPYSSTEGLLFYTYVVSAEELEEFQRDQEDFRQFREERRQKRLEAEAKANEEEARVAREKQEKAEADAAELLRLAELGRKHEKNCKKEKR